MFGALQGLCLGIFRFLARRPVRGRSRWTKARYHRFTKRASISPNTWRRGGKLSASSRPISRYWDPCPERERHHLSPGGRSRFSGSKCPWDVPRRPPRAYPSRCRWRPGAAGGLLRASRPQSPGEHAVGELKSFRRQSTSSLRYWAAWEASDPRRVRASWHLASSSVLVGAESRIGWGTWLRR